MAIELIRAFFPDDEGMVTQYKIGSERAQHQNLGAICGSLRKYPLELQVAFLQAYLTMLSGLREEHTQAPAKMLVEINMKPVRNPQYSLEEIQQLANQGLTACNLDGDSLPKIVATPLQKAEETAKQIVNAWDNSHLRVAWESVPAAGHKIDRLISNLSDPAYSGLFMNGVRDDFMHESGWTRKLVPIFYPRRGRTCLELYHAPKILFINLALASAWEVAGDKMTERGYPGNPFRPFVTIARPGLLPLGWDDERRFVVADVNLINRKT